MNIDLSAPIWCIDHIATVLGVSVDTAREHTYSPTFPEPRAGFSRNLWLREEFLAWFASLPAADRTRPERRKHSRTARGDVATSAHSPHNKARGKSYTPRTTAGSAA